MRGKFYVIAEQISADMGRIVRETVGSYRRRGMKTTEAWMHAGNTLGIGWRRVKAYVYGEVRAVPAHEALALAAAWERSAAARVANLQAELEAEVKRMKGLQSRCDHLSALLRGAPDAGH